VCNKAESIQLKYNLIGHKCWKLKGIHYWVVLMNLQPCHAKWHLALMLQRCNDTATLCHNALRGIITHEML